MNPLLLRISGLIAFISGQPRQSLRRGLMANLMSTTQSVLLASIVLGVGFLATYTITLQTRSWVNDDAVEEAVRLMILETLKPADAAILRQELAGKLVMAVYNPEGSHGVSVLVGIDTLPVPDHDPCDPERIAMPEGTICLFRARPVFPSQTWLAPFVSFDFPGSAYTIPHLAISAAKAANPEINFTQSRSARTRQLIEKTLGANIFLPSSDVVLWGRRINGPIQAVTIWLTASALMMLLLAWLNSCVQNGIVKRTQSVVLDEFDPLPPVVASEANQELDPAIMLTDETSEAGNAAAGLDLGTNPHPESAPGPEPEEAVKETQMRIRGDFPTPWSGNLVNATWLDLSDADTTARYYDRVATSIHAQSAVGGVTVDPPALRLRRAAARAVANTDDTSILPSFLDAQKDSILAYYDARLSLVRFMLWAIPTVGFIGTIIGVSDALSFTIGLQSASDLVAGIAQSSVSASMGLAFDTTLVALVAAVMVMLAYHLVQGAEERMTVLERDQAESEILELSRSVRKPGTTGDLAQQLILLGIDSQKLIKELGLFRTSGPEFRNLITTLREQTIEMEDAVGKMQRSSKRSSWVWRALILTCVFGITLIFLVTSGVFGAAAQNWIAEILSLFSW